MACRMMDIKFNTIFLAIFCFGLVSSPSANELDKVAACSGVIIGNASIDFNLGDESSFDEKMNWPSQLIRWSARTI